MSTDLFEVSFSRHSPGTGLALLLEHSGLKDRTKTVRRNGYLIDKMSRKETDVDMDMGSLSYVKVLANFSTKIVRLTNHENNDDESCGPQDIDTAPSLFVPWAQSEGDYNGGRKLSVGLWENGALIDKFWMWERSGEIYYNTTDKWSETAPKVPGNSQGGGVKAFALKDKNGTLSISLSKVP